MIEPSVKLKAPFAWLPAALISWYAPGGLPAALVTSWVALIGGDSPRLRTAWHGNHNALSRFWGGGDFVLNVPHEVDLDRIRELMRQGKLCMNAEQDFGCRHVPGVEAVAPRLLDCAVQLECVSGSFSDAGDDTELCGDVVFMHRGQVVVDVTDIPDLCALSPLSP